jgi:ABC-type protease/lipase transport system fused ATPase/permease subunit
VVKKQRIALAAFSETLTFAGGQTNSNLDTAGDKALARKR